MTTSKDKLKLRCVNLILTRSGGEIVPLLSHVHTSTIILCILLCILTFSSIGFFFGMTKHNEPTQLVNA